MKKQVLETLARVRYREADVVGTGIVASVMAEGGKVGVILNAAGSQEEMEAISRACEKAIQSLPGVEAVTVVITAEKSAPKPERPKPPTPKPVAGIRHIIAVGSGKGGVGKSTVAVNLAVALAERGYATGLADADIHGPSIARMMGVKGKPDIRENRMIPPMRHGVKVMSMGLLLEEDSPVVWRGPMISKALGQLMLGADWGTLDCLILDLPPGTGDIHLSLAQNFQLSGAVVVSTPQEVALLDVKKAIAMFRKVNVPVLGLVENMSFYEEPRTGEKTYLFGKEGAVKLARQEKIPLLAQIPVLPEISETSDSGTPLAARKGHPLHALFREISGNLLTNY